MQRSLYWRRAGRNYNERVWQALENYHFEKQHFFAITKGRSKGERAVIKVEGGKYRDFDFVQEDADDSVALHSALTFIATTAKYDKSSTRF